MTGSGSEPTGGDRPAVAPYGPATASIRRFLVRLAALDDAARETVVARFTAVANSRAFAAADMALAETIERSGRADAQDALAGPLLQLVRRREHTDAFPADVSAESAESAEGADAEGAGPALDALAEPALAALLALLVRDLLPPAQFHLLYSAFADAIPAEAPED
jgi:hypothetical protein